MANFYSRYYEKRFYRCPADGLNFLEKIMESAEPSAGYVMLAHLLTHTTYNVVVTTNFDHLTEDSVNYYAHKTPLVIGHEALAHYVVGQQTRPTVVKIHRDLLFDPKNSTAEVEALAANWESALSRIFENYHPVFIGYAGNDKSVMDFLLKNAEKFASDKWKYPYWMLYKTETPSGQIGEFLDKSGGYYIFHSGFDDVMIQLGAKFGYKIPTQEEFLTDARMRYKKLNDAIEEFTSRTNSPSPVPVATSEPARAGKAAPSEESIEEKEDVNQALAEITDRSTMQNTFREAVVLAGSGKYDEAADILEGLIENDPNNARYHCELSQLYLWADKGDEALQEANKAVELEPKNAETYVALGMALSGKDENEAALRAMKTAVGLEPENGSYHFILANVLKEAGEREEALSEFTIAIEIEPEDWLAHYNKGKLLRELGEYDEALNEYARVVEYEPGFSSGYYVIADIYEAKGETERALEEYVKYSALDPEWPLPYYKAAIILTKLNRYGEALEKVQEAISRKPEKIYLGLRTEICEKLGIPEPADMPEDK